ncbi:hypothetical protein [Roseibacillus persicicus]|uniref:hypothetical protein n=1 Tax=Roseibacillus persicicus TaxID=454148 RepID=UPI0028105FCC|nr:hypothetical protein [Roseibacillus persicicus]MDQ8192067.1 hypothetical protein [Roseibacillus persicicus]
MITKTIFLAGVLTAGLSAESAPSSHQTVTGVAKECSTHIEAALELAEGEASNLANLVTRLRTLGFGQTPPPHPAHNKDSGSEKKELTEEERMIEEDHAAERAGRLKQMSKADIAFVQKLDLNKDFTLTSEEVVKSLQEQIGEAIDERLLVDQNQDRRLTGKEYSLSVPARGEVGEDGMDWHQRGHFKHEDSNGDGYVDEHELLANQASEMLQKAQQIHFVMELSTLDQNEDMVLEKEEVGDFLDEKLWEKLSATTGSIPTSSLWQQSYWLGSEQMAPSLRKK